MIDYYKFWEITAPVFNRRTDPQQIFFNHALKEQTEKLLTIIAQPRTIVAVHGTPGSGKTLLASWLHGHLDYKSHEALLLLPTGSALEEGWLINKICQFMCGAIGAKQPLKKQFRLTSIAMDQLIEENRMLTVLIDNAEKLVNSRNLEELIDLFAIQALSGHCLSFVLVGDSTLQHDLSQQPRIGSLVSFMMEIPPIIESELQEYLGFHSKRSGLKVSPFTANSIAAIASVSKGNPSTINKIAENCLIECAAAGELFANDLIVLQACRNVLPNITEIKKQRKENGGQRATMGRSSVRSRLDNPNEQAGHTTAIYRPETYTMPILNSNYDSEKSTELPIQNDLDSILNLQTAADHQGPIHYTSDISAPLNQNQSTPPPQEGIGEGPSYRETPTEATSETNEIFQTTPSNLTTAILESINSDNSSQDLASKKTPIEASTDAQKPPVVKENRVINLSSLFRPSEKKKTGSFGKDSEK